MKNSSPHKHFRFAPAVHERLEKLRERGIIEGYTALLDRNLIGQPVLVITHVHLEKQATRELQDFETAVQELLKVQFLLQVYGGWNFSLHITAPTQQAYFDLL